VGFRNVEALLDFGARTSMLKVMHGFPKTQRTLLTVQTLLGHKWVDTTLGYARLYDGAVAADYYGATTGRRPAAPANDRRQGRER
jgi:hypothetical protein